MKAQETATQFASELAAALGPRLNGALLYGSAARGEYVEGRSDINVLVLVDDISGSSLGAASPVVRKYVRQGVHPVVVEAAEWRRATDVFAIEIADMHDAHVALRGEDPLASLEIALPILRLQAERELRGKLLQIYLALLVTEKPDEVGTILSGMMPSIVTYFRTALRLARREVPMDSVSVLQAAGELTGADVSVLLPLLDAHRTGEKVTIPLSDPRIDAFNSSTETLVKFIDTFGR